MRFLQHPHHRPSLAATLERIRREYEQQEAEARIARPVAPQLLNEREWAMIARRRYG